MAGLVGDIGSGLIGLPRWWLGELGALVPGWLRRAFVEQPKWAVFDMAGREIVVSRGARDRLRVVGRVDLATPPAKLRGRVARLARKVDARNATVVLRLAEAHALRKEVELPLAAEENLRQVLAFEMDRQTPFKPHEVYFDYRVLARDEERQRLRAEVTVMPRTVVEKALETAASWRIEPDVVDLADGQGAAPGALNLLPQERAPNQRGGGGALNTLLGLVALGLMGTVIYQVLERQDAVVAIVQQRMATAKVEAEVVTGLREELDALVRDGRFLRDRKDASPAKMAVLEELTRVLPDHTWVYQLRLNDAEVQVWGYASAASEIISLIDASPLFHSPKFRSPVTRDTRLGLERFNLSAAVKSGRGQDR